MTERACDCGVCSDCKRAGVDHFTRRGVLRGFLGAATALTQEAPAVEPAAASAMEKEAFANLKALYVAQKAYFAERDRYSTDLDAIGFAPDEWCQDGARLTIKEKPSAAKKIGCHFVYEVETMDRSRQFRAHARGAAGAALGRDFLVESSGEHMGIPRRNRT